MRRDLPVGVMAAMIIHAAGESSPGQLPPGTHAVALAARDEAHLRFIEHKLRALDISHTAVLESDAPWNGALMAIGIPPTSEQNRLKPITKSLRLIQ